jgi:Kef-type K+ transport system membrane component KefB
LVLLLGLTAEKLIYHCKLPAVTGYLIIGMLAGPSLLNILNPATVAALASINSIALGLIAFLIGGELSLDNLRKCGQSVLWITFSQVLGAFCLVALSLYFLAGVELPVALLFAAVSCATAPAAVMMVLREYRAKGPLTESLLAVVALDDAVCLILYAIAVSVAKVLVGENISLAAAILKPFWELAASLLGGAVAGFFLVWLSKKMGERDDSLVLVLGMVFLLAGGAELLQLSPLLVCMSLGFFAVNLAPGESAKIFRIIKSLDTPVYVMFFVAAGANLHLSELAKLGTVGTVYIIARVLGKMAGAGLGGVLGKAAPVVRKYLGLGLVPQAGVAIGLTLLLANDFPAFARIITPVILASVVVYEIIGPFCVKLAVSRAGEVNKAEDYSCI